jgi:hypothetical protein
MAVKMAHTRSDNFVRMSLRQVACVALVASVAGLVWLPRVPSVISAVFAVVLVCTLVVELVRSREKVVVGTVGWLITLFVAVRVLAVWNEPQELGGFDTILSLVISLAIFLSMALPQWDDRLARRVMTTFVLSATVVAVVHWWLARGYVAVAGSDALGVELASTGINRNDFGQLLATATILAFLLIRLSGHSRTRRLAWTTILVLDLALLVALGSRSSLALASIGFLLNLVIERPEYAYWGLAALACTTALLSRLLAWTTSLGTAAPETLRRGAALVQALMTGDASQIAVEVGRVSYWRAGWASFVESPIWGVGEGTARSMVLQQTGDYTYAHSTLIILLAESGLVGATIYYVSCLILASRLSQSVRRASYGERHIAAALLAYEFAFLVTGAFAVTGLDKSTFILLGLGTALASQCNREKHSNSESMASPTNRRVRARHSNMRSHRAGADPERVI